MQASPRLYVHCGWPKTGTKSLQVALSRHRSALAEVGVVYPDKWRWQLLPEIPDASHNGLVEVIDAVQGADPPLDEFLAFLADHASHSILLSSELIALRVLRPERADAISKLFAAVSEVMPVSCIWALRRFDDLVCSLYPQFVSLGMRLPPPAAFFASVDPCLLFDGMRRIEASVDEVAYVQYRRDGAHSGELLDALGVPRSVRAGIERAAVESRLNASLTHKQTLALLEVDSLSRRAGMAFDEVALRGMFRTGQFEFEHDGACELAGREMRRRLRDDALRCSERDGPRAYARFFALSEEPEEPEAPAAPPASLSDDDLARLTRAYAASLASGG